MKYIKLFENLNTDKIDDLLIEYIDNDQCIKIGNENCWVYMFQSRSWISNAISRLNKFNTKFEFINCQTHKAIIVPSKKVINYLDSKFSDIREISQEEIESEFTKDYPNNTKYLISKKYYFSYNKRSYGKSWNNLIYYLELSNNLTYTIHFDYNKVWSEFESKFNLYDTIEIDEDNGSVTTSLISASYAKNHLKIDIVACSW